MQKRMSRRAFLFCVALAACAVFATAVASASHAGIASRRVDRSCHKVGPVTMRLIVSGLKRGRRFTGTGYEVRTGIPPVSQSFGKSFWFMAARIRGRGIGVWATTLAPSLTRKPSSGNTIDAANAVAWKNSDWGSFPEGSFPKNYGSPPTVPPLSNPARPKAISCVH